jgi:hypothetical protein
MVQLAFEQGIGKLRVLPQLIGNDDFAFVGTTGPKSHFLELVTRRRSAMGGTSVGPLLVELIRSRPFGWWLGVGRKRTGGIAQSEYRKWTFTPA